MGRQKLSTLVLLFVVLVLDGCSTIKHYKAELPHNLNVISNTESVEATLDIYSLGKQCETAYLGTIALDKKILALGLATGQPSYIRVGFVSSSFWGNSSGFTNYDISLLPLKPYRYEITVSYIDDIYNVAVYEINRSTGKKREMEDKELGNCLI